MHSSPGPRITAPSKHRSNYSTAPDKHWPAPWPRGASPTRPQDNSATHRPRRLGARRWLSLSSLDPQHGHPPLAALTSTGDASATPQHPTRPDYRPLRPQGRPPSKD
eukprot:4734565-Pyramimonas_sp.AAC.1